MTSQKTLPVSVTVISFLGSVGEVGLMTIPCIIGHLSQLFIDAYISSRWASEVDPDEDSGASAVTGTEMVGNKEAAEASSMGEKQEADV